MSSYQYRKSHCGDKTILWPSYLHNGTSYYTGKMTSLYWIRAQIPISHSSPMRTAMGCLLWELSITFNSGHQCALCDVVILHNITKKKKIQGFFGHNWMFWIKLHSQVSKCVTLLTHWGRVMHICVSKATIIVSDNGLSPSRRQAIT